MAWRSRGKGEEKEDGDGEAQILILRARRPVTNEAFRWPANASRNNLFGSVGPPD